jgi:hypothetical protein
VNSLLRSAPTTLDTDHVNTVTTSALTKILRAFAVLFASLAVFWIAIPSVTIIGLKAGGAQTTGLGWQGCIIRSLIYLLAATVLLLCSRVSRRDHRGSLAEVLLWSVAIVTGAYAAYTLSGLVRWAIQ